MHCPEELRYYPELQEDTHVLLVNVRSEWQFKQLFGEGPKQDLHEESHAKKGK